MNKKKVTIHNIKQALMDERFRESLPDTLQEDIGKFLKNPGCACNHPIYLNVMKKAGSQVRDYFPAMEASSVEDLEKSADKVAANSWQVINCTKDELVFKLRELGPGRKQLDVARYKDDVTIVVNHLEGIY
jgi:hypothetical protein